MFRSQDLTLCLSTFSRFQNAKGKWPLPVSLISLIEHTPALPVWRPLLLTLLQKLSDID